RKAGVGVTRFWAVGVLQKTAFGRLLHRAAGLHSRWTHRKTSARGRASRWRHRRTGRRRRQTWTWGRSSSRPSTHRDRNRAITRHGHGARARPWVRRIGTGAPAAAGTAATACMRYDDVSCRMRAALLTANAAASCHPVGALLRAAATERHRRRAASTLLRVAGFLVHAGRAKALASGGTQALKPGLLRGLRLRRHRVCHGDSPCVWSLYTK